MILKFLKQVILIFVVSAIIILSYEALERWESLFMHAWESNILTLLFISVIVAIAFNTYHRIKRKKEANELKLRSATENLTVSEEKYKRLFEENLAGIFVTDGDGFITDCNSSLLMIFGYPDKKDLIGKHISVLYSDPDEFDRLRKELEKKKVIRNYQTKRKRQNGELIDIIKNISANTDSAGRITEINGYIHDISDFKRAEKAVRDSEKTARLLLNTSASINILINAADYRIMDINHAGATYLGLSAEALKSRKLTDVLSTKPGNVGARISEALSTKQPVRFQEESSGKNYYYQIYPIAGIDGEIIRIGFFAHDITGMKQIRELKLLNTELTESNATKDRLFSIIAHDLKAPLSGILNVSELLRNNLKQYNYEKTDRFLESICCSSENMLVLLENLLIWSKTRKGNTYFSPVHVKLTPLVSEVLGVLRATATNKNIAVNNNVHDDAVCFADVNMLKTILRNLIQNALKFTNQSGEVRIDSTVKDGVLEISVSDNGVGISSKIVNELFEGHRNNSLAGTANEKGSGLGLVLCRDFAERNSGSLIVESQPGKGSTFFLRLPVCEHLN